MRPPVRFADAGNLQIAYSTFGAGPDIVVAPGWVSNVEHIWDVELGANFFSELARHFRVTLFDKRGTGLSDRNVGMPTLEDRTDDLRAVMDDAGIASAVIFGISESSSLAILFAATYPDRVDALALYGAFVCREKKPDYPWAPSPEERQQFYDGIKSYWSGDMDLGVSAPSLEGNQIALEQLSRYIRSSASPAGALELAKLNTAIDVRHVLPTIRCRTVVIHRIGDRDVKIAEGRYIASKIPNAEIIELPAVDHIPFVGDTKPILDALRRVVGPVKQIDSDRRILSTILFTDIVDSTSKVREVGDAKWSASISIHNETVQRLVAKYRGALVKFTGDGVLAHFDGPARAAKCALEIGSEVRKIGLDVRAAVHTCEIEVIGDDIFGIGVHLAARAMTVAGAGEVVATPTVKGLVSGSGLSFEPAGTHTFKGFGEPVEVFKVR
jgi:pimeloyl-ACP methyl ester carboxylesterase/class 3 adenylate cyclase